MESQRVSPWARYTSGYGATIGSNAVPYSAAGIVIGAVLILFGLAYAFKGHIHF